MKKYNLIIDYGKPYEEKGKTEEEVFKILEELNILVENEDFAYCDIFIFNENEKDLTDIFFKKYHKLKNEFLSLRFDDEKFKEQYKENEFIEWLKDYEVLK
jgi:5'-3' exonuclease